MQTRPGICQRVEVFCTKRKLSPRRVTHIRQSSAAGRGLAGGVVSKKGPNDRRYREPLFAHPEKTAQGGGDERESKPMAREEEEETAWTNFSVTARIN